VKVSRGTWASECQPVLWVWKVHSAWNILISMLRCIMLDNKSFSLRFQFPKNLWETSRTKLQVSQNEHMATRWELRQPEINNNLIYYFPLSSIWRMEYYDKNCCTFFVFFPTKLRHRKKLQLKNGNIVLCDFKKEDVKNIRGIVFPCI